ncbi:MAG TPA: hypothetical protein VH105_25585 [Burkholderiales bacterium]|jgi:hypothetical protein|nr:hypothetical protein [Burkholderiales bacterium]
MKPFMKPLCTLIALPLVPLALAAPVYAQSGTAPGSINVPGGSNTDKGYAPKPGKMKKNADGTMSPDTRTKGAGAGGGGSSNGSPDNSMNAGGIAGGSTVSRPAGS